MKGALDESEYTPAETREASGPDQRVEHRHRVLKSAHAAFGKEFGAIPCVVRNVSESGAKVDFNEFGLVPRTFTLYIDLDGYKVECERVWQEGKSCGVRFIGEKVPIKVFRTQVLGSSETALSKGTIHQMEMHGHNQDFVPQRELNSDEGQPTGERRRPAQQQRPTFGKRQ